MNKIKEYIKEKLIDIKINKDKEILEFIYISLDSLEKNKESLTDKLLEEIEKSINYLVMNIKNEEKKECKEMYNLFFLELCSLKKIKGVNKAILKFKYEVYYLFAVVYKMIKSLV